MKVKITGCKRNLMWYKDKIGQVFDAEWNVQYDGYEVLEKSHEECYIYPDDCIDIIEYRKEKFERILK